MNELERDFRLFTASLGAGSPRKDSKTAPRAAQLLEDYPEDPGFWLQYAQTCLANDDFPEASAALDRLQAQLDRERKALPLPSAVASILDVLGWWKQRCATDILKVAARGNPSLRSDLIRALQRQTELSYESMGRRLAEARAQYIDDLSPETPLDARWVRQLDRLAASHAPGNDNDLNVIHDLATALMGSGRFAEAEQLYEELPFATFATSKRETELKSKWYPLLIHWLKNFLQDPLLRVAAFSAPGDRYVLTMVVWGDDFLDSLERFTLPSLLAAGNLPYIRGAGEAHIQFFTTEAGARRLEQMRAFQAVRSILTVDVVCFPEVLTEFPNTYLLMSALHLASMAVAKASHAHFFFLAPDIVVADNFLKVIDQRMRNGAEVVFVPGLTLQMESFEEDQANRFPPEQLAISIRPRQLLELGMKHLHPFVKQTYTHSPLKRRPWASVLLWPLADGGYLGHYFHHSPYLISAKAMQRFDVSLFIMIDGEFPLRIIRSEEELEHCVLLADTLETNFFELSRGSRFDFLVEFDMNRLCRWGALQGFVAKWLFRQRVCFDPSGLGKDDPALTASKEVVEEVLRGMEIGNHETRRHVGDGTSDA